MKNLFLVRHGQSMQNTFENYKLKLPDHKVYLTDLGKEQAHDVGIILNDYFIENKLDKDSSIMFNSPYLRTRETSDIINNILNIRNRKEDYLLIEHQYGLFSDNYLSENKDKYPDYFEYVSLFYKNEGKFYVKYPMGESPMDVAIRTGLFLEKLKKYYDEYENILLVSHGSTLKTLEMNVFEYSPEWYSETKHMKNCEARVITDWDNENKKMKILRK